MMVLVLPFGACAQPDRPPGPSWSVATHPRAADRYARLLRAALTDSDPPAAMQRLLCESARLARALGATEAARRTAAVYDTVVRTPAARAAARRTGAAASGREYAISGEVCDSLRAIADREDGPIPPAPDSMMWR